jgi:multiple sugar transport system substrate-binding protein
MKVVEKNKILIIALFVVLSFAIGMYPIVIKNKIGDSEKSASNTLKVYVLQTQGKNYLLLQTSIDDFKKKYPKINIEEVPISSDNDEYSKKLLTDTLAGNGPDVLYFDPQELNVYTMQKSQILQDLKPFIEKDKDFSGDNYNKAVLSAGEYNGQMTFIPLDYYVNSYITTSQLLKENNIELKDNISQNDFILAINKYVSLISGDESKTLFAYPISITDWIGSSGINFIDYEDKKTYFNKPEFKNVIDNYKIIYNSSPKEADIMATSGKEGFNAIKAGTTLFSDDKLFLSDMLESQSKIKAVTGEDQVINSLPTYNGGNKAIAMVGECMAINKNSKNKLAAYNFIKTALSAKMDAKDYGVYIPLQYIPISKKSREAIVNQYFENKVGKSEKISKHGGNVIMEKPSDEFETYYNKITQNIEKTETTDNTLDKLMMQCLTPYFEGKESYDSVIRTLDQKVKLYLNE